MRNTKINQLYRSVNVTAAQSQNCQFVVNTVIQLKNIIRQYRHLTGYVSTKGAGTVGCSSYIFLAQSQY
jgi:hypothetical protein